MNSVSQAFGNFWRVYVHSIVADARHVVEWFLLAELLRKVIGSFRCWMPASSHWTGACGHLHALRSDSLARLCGTRAQFMELASSRPRPVDARFADIAFITGVFLLVQVLFGGSIEDILSKLPVHGDIRRTARTARRIGATVERRRSGRIRGAHGAPRGV